MKIIIAIVFILYPYHTYSQTIPAMQHGTVYKKVTNVADYWVSEKLDGVRGYWDGKQLLTRQGNQIKVPSWFTQHWPTQAVEGELWIARSRFEQIASIISQHSAPTKQWQQVRFMIFDLPTEEGNFSTRNQRIATLVHQVNSPYFQAIKQRQFQTSKQLFSYLDQVVAQGGEGLMLHHKKSQYKVGRNQQLMKLKKYQDAEAIVVAHHQGKGKYQGKLGAITVATPAGKQFKIGSGFTDEQRENPPPIGSQITYKYFGKTQKGTPKFASFMRIKTSLMLY
jgi:DNA ligase-1